MKFREENFEKTQTWFQGYQYTPSYIYISYGGYFYAQITTDKKTFGGYFYAQITNLKKNIWISTLDF